MLKAIKNRWAQRFWIMAVMIMSGIHLPSLALPASDNGSFSPDFTEVFSRHRQQFNKVLVTYFLDRLFNNKDLTVIDTWVDKDIIRHNSTAADGRQALRQAIEAVQAEYPDSGYELMRVIAEGDLVVAHSLFTLQSGVQELAVVDIFRLDKGRLVEHWNLQQPVPETTTSGNDMFSTLSNPRVPWPNPFASTAVSRDIALGLFNEAFVGKDVTAFDRYLSDGYLQHNPAAENGLEAVKAVFAGFFAQFPDVDYSFGQMIAEGDLVVLHYHFTLVPGTPGFEVVDMFRVRDAKIVEHWDVVQPSETAN